MFPFLLLTRVPLEYLETPMGKEFVSFKIKGIGDIEATHLCDLVRHVPRVTSEKLHELVFGKVGLSWQQQTVDAFGLQSSYLVG